MTLALPPRLVALSSLLALCTVSGGADARTPSKRDRDAAAPASDVGRDAAVDAQAWQTGPQAGPLVVGDRVRRGPDWKWGEQDGGAGTLGTVVTAPTATEWAKVEWDGGIANTYRWGHEDRFDLERRGPSGAPAPVRAPAADGVSREIRALDEAPGSGDWDREVSRILRAAYDADASGTLQTAGEVAAVPCSVLRTLEAEFARSPDYSSSMRKVYGFPASFGWVGGSIGFSEAVRPAASARWFRCTHPLETGARVVRGPDWKWDAQDGGPGGVGTVTAPPTAEVWAKVRWDAGGSNTYRWGHEDAQDLTILEGDSVAAPPRLGGDGAAGSPAWDAEVRQQLVLAHDTDGSGTIDRTDEVDGVPCTTFVALDHAFAGSAAYPGSSLRGVYGVQAGLQWVGGALGFSESVRGHLDQRWTTCTEAGARSMSAVGGRAALALGTRVMRGPDWKWDTQDGGPRSLGTVVDVPTDTVWAKVEWDAGGSNTYRWGHSGAYDLVVVDGGAPAAQLIRAIEATDWTGQAGGARSEVRPLLMAAYDRDGSDAIDDRAELAAMSCDVLLAVQARYVRGGHFSGAMRAVFGIEEGYGWVGGALGFAEPLRTATDRTMVACGLE